MPVAEALARIRLLRALGPLPKKRRLPRQKPPTLIALALTKEIVRLVAKPAAAAFAEVERDLIEDLRRVRKGQQKGDARALPLDRLGPICEAVAERMGTPRKAPAIVADPNGGELVGGVRAVLAVYEPEADRILFGAEPLRVLSRPLGLGRISSDEDVLAVKVVLHEAIHAAARGRGEGGVLDVTSWALLAIEEGTAEIAAQLLVPELAERFGRVTELALLRAKAPLFRWEDGDLRLTRPTSYPTWASRIARLAFLARVPLLDLVVEVRKRAGAARLGLIGEWLGRDPNAVGAYLGRPRGERDDLRQAANAIGLDVPETLPAWLAEGGPIGEGEIPGFAVKAIRAAEAVLTSPSSTAADALAALRVVDDLGDPRASFHGRAALQQRVNLFGPFVGQAAEGVTAPTRQAALILAFDRKGRLLLGRQREGGLWSLPGGYAEEDETPRQAAARELEEETNLTTGALALLLRFRGRDGVEIYVYRAEVSGTPTAYFDPDEEHVLWRFFAVARGLPVDVASYLAGPAGPENVLRQLFHVERSDAPVPLGSERRTASAAIDRAAARFRDSFRPRELEVVVQKFGRRTSDWQKRQLDAQVRAAMGVPFSAIEQPIRDRVDEWAARNVDLIVTVADRYFDRLRLDVEDAYESGMHPETLARKFRDRYDMSERDARRIARDQIGSLNAEVNQARQEALGIERYIWRTMNDNRVRDNHFDLDGEEFSYSDPPMGGGTSEDEEGNPGTGISCRCYGEPLFDDLLGAEAA